MEIFGLKSFVRFARKERLEPEVLLRAISDAERGLVDADLGGGLIKLRIARRGEGKSGGYRTIVAYRKSERAVFLFGYAKSAMDNIEDDELQDWREVAVDLLGATQKELVKLITMGDLKEIVDV